MIALEADVDGKVGPMRIRAALRTDDGPLVLAGPNGAGKTSLLAMILGALAPTRGRITLGDDVLYDSAAGVDVPVEQRRLGYVPQDYGLFPHLTVHQNVRFAVESSPARDDRRERRRRAEALIAELGLEGLAGRSVTTLSGGERQRVALARALAARPRALLLDEPLAALDVHARREVRAFLACYLEELALPTIVITHDPDDARALGRRVVVMEHGERVQAGTWAELAARPSTPFVEALARH